MNIELTKEQIQQIVNEAKANEKKFEPGQVVFVRLADGDISPYLMDCYDPNGLAYVARCHSSVGRSGGKSAFHVSRVFATLEEALNGT